MKKVGVHTRPIHNSKANRAAAPETAHPRLRARLLARAGAGVGECGLDGARKKARTRPCCFDQWENVKLSLLPRLVLMKSLNLFIPWWLETGVQP